MRLRILNHTGHTELELDTEETIKRLIGDMTLEMSAEDYNPLPDMVVNDVNIELPDNLRAMYDKMEKEFFIALLFLETAMIGTFAALDLLPPEVAYDLPTGGRRLLQRARGYRHTFVAGTEVLRDDELTGQTPGRLIRG